MNPILIQRVVRAYQRKQAGVFEPPPRMVETLSEWIWPTALQMVLGQLNKRIDETYTWLNRLTLPGEVTGTLNKITNILFAFKPQAYLLDKLVKSISDPRIKKQLETLVSQVMLRNEIQSQVREPIYDIEVSKKFPYDFRGWKHEKLLPARSLEEFSDWKLNVTVTYDALGVKAVSGALFKEKEGLRLQVALTEIPEDLRDLNKLKQQLLNDTLKHELMHVSQYLMAHSDAAAPEEERHKRDVGYPSSKMRDREMHQPSSAFGMLSNPEQYYLDDQEFFTWIHTTIEALSTILEDLPYEHHREVFEHVVSDGRLSPDVRDYIRKFGSYSTLLFEDLPEFYQYLRKFNSDKYRRAVKEVYQQLTRRGADL